MLSPFAGKTQSLILPVKVPRSNRKFFRLLKKPHRLRWLHRLLPPNQFKTFKPFKSFKVVLCLSGAYYRSSFTLAGAML